MSGPSMKKSKVETVEQQVSQWCHLPDDILALILSHLFGKDYLCFLSVCRSWRSAPPRPRTIPNPYFSKARSRYPSLFHFSGNRSECKFYDPFCNGSYVDHRIPDELIDSRIYFSDYGWLLMSRGVRLFFFHPFTNQRIDLPFTANKPIFGGCGKFCFSSPPTSPDCIVFAIGDGDHFSTIRRGNFSFTLSTYRPSDVRFYSSHSNPVFYKGAFYCSSLDGELGVFHPNGYGWKYNCWKLKFPCESIRENFLAESNGELISICMSGVGEQVRVFRLNSDCKISWEEVHSLGDRMIFASRTGCISMQTGTMGNTIYFPNFDNGGNGLFYSLTSHKFHSLGLALARKDLFNTRRMSHCAWIIPTASEICIEDEQRIWLIDELRICLSILENSIPRRVKVKTASHAHSSFVPTNHEDSNDQLFFNKFDSYHKVKEMPEVCQMFLATYAFGWLFQVDGYLSNCLLLNPQSMEKIHLPLLPDKFFCYKVAISSSPSDPNCRVLLVQNCGSTIEFIYCRPGESYWTSKIIGRAELMCDHLKFKDKGYDAISNVIGYRGKIYCLMSKLKLVEIDFDPTFQVKKNVQNGVCLPWDSLGRPDNYKIYMVESCGELFVIRINFHGYAENPSNIDKVEVFKLDFAEKIWETVGSLSEKVALFCYGDGCCFSCCSMEMAKRKLGNSIYFIGTVLDSENIYAFHFEDGSISISLAFSDVGKDDLSRTF